MAQVQKCFGDLPEDVVVLSEVVAFDAEGYATVSDEVAEILDQVPGYAVLGDAEELDGVSPVVDPGVTPAVDPGVTSAVDPGVTSEDPTEDPEVAPEGQAGVTTSTVRRNIRRAAPVK